MSTIAPPSTWRTLSAAPHRLQFFTGMCVLMLSSAWWGLHLFARQTGRPLAALELSVAPIWAHTFLMLFLVFPTFFFGFLFTTFPRWMNGPNVPRGAYVATSLGFAAAAVAWIVGLEGPPQALLAAGGAATLALLIGTATLARVLIDAEQGVSHGYVVLLGLSVLLVSLVGFVFGLARHDDIVLHFAVRTALWGGLLPVFFAVCHRMIPFFSQNVVPGYVAWRPLWVLVAVVTVVYGRLALGTAGTLGGLVVLDVALFVLTALCALRWTALRSRGNPLLWTLYLGFAWLPIAALLQAVRDFGFALTGEWLLGRAPIHALGMGYFASLLVAMVTRVTMGHSGRPLVMDRIAFGCLLAVQAATIVRVCGEVHASPEWAQRALLLSISLWLAAFAVWTWRLGRIYLAPRIDGKPG